MPPRCPSPSILFFFKFIYFEKEQACTNRGGVERENVRTVSTEPDEGLGLTNPEIITWPEIKSWKLNWATQVPQEKVLILRFYLSQNKANIKTLSKVSQILLFLGAPGWLSQWSVWLQLRSWSQSSWVWALSRALCWQLRAWSLLQVLCVPLSLSKINKHRKIK